MSAESERLVSALPAAKSDELRVALRTPYACVDDVVTGVAALERVFRARGDRRAVFATAYLCITRELQRRLQAGAFADNAWVSRYLLSFANLYREALADFESGNLVAVPRSWQISFETSAGGTGLVIQDLLLGINAHINHDLALALLEVSIDPEQPRRYQDHLAVNEGLRAGIDQLQERVAQMYAPELSDFDQALGTLDEHFALFGVAVAREGAWEAAVALTNARDERERREICAGLDDRAAVLAKLILDTSPAFQALTTGLHLFERMTAWWQQVVDEDILPYQAQDRDAPGSVLAQQRPMADL